MKEPAQAQNARPLVPQASVPGHTRGAGKWCLSVKCVGSRGGILWHTHGRIHRQAHWPNMQTNVLARALEVPRWLPGLYGRRIRYIRFPVASCPLVCHGDAYRDDRLPKDAAPLISLDLKVWVECHDAI